MRSLLKLLQKKTHAHNYRKPIVSRYISFNTREIVYQCYCGARRAEKVYRDFSDPFPIDTAPFLTMDDIRKIVNYEKSL